LPRDRVFEASQTDPNRVRLVWGRLGQCALWAFPSANVESGRVRWSERADRRGAGVAHCSQNTSLWDSAARKQQHSMAKPPLALVTPATVNGTVVPRRPPTRRPNVETRARKYLTHTEVEKLMKAAGENRNGHRDASAGYETLPQAI
jgi:hypothetical protein